MLAVGTDYEYYNAVWVKNEWSRYLMLMAKDRKKHLIPCYKNIDAYDMPKEFAKLQAQDMGKVGAMQDLLRGIEKILPKQQPVTVAREKVIVGGSGDNKIASLLDRGNMALEDGDWAKADSFFEDVLNNDSKNAQAYLGKALAQERCRTIDALVRKRLGIHEQAKAETRSIPERTEHIRRMAEKYTVPNYVTAEIIQKLYAFDRTYPSEVSDRQVQYENEKSWWENHKLLSRAEKFGTGAVAENFQQEKKSLFSQLAARVKSSQEADAKRVKELEKAYDAAMQEADRKVEALSLDGQARREADYQGWLAAAKDEYNPQMLRKLAADFSGLGDYRDSRNLAQHCEKRAEEEQGRLDAEAEKQSLLAEQKKKERQKKNKTIAIIAAAAVAIVIIAKLVVTKAIIPGSHYKAAEELLAAGDYAGAVEAFGALGAYKDAPERVLAIYYAEAEALLNAGNFDDAAEAFAALGEYEDAAEQVFAVYFTKAQSLLAAGDNISAAIAFGQAGDYQDAKQQSMDLWNTFAVRETVGAGDSHTVGLKADGTVVAVGYNNHHQCEVDDWQDIVAVSAGGWHTVGLKSDGTVVAVGEKNDRQCDVSSWENIVAVSAGGYHTVGLKSDGTVVAAGDNRDGQCDVSDWKNIVAISAGDWQTVGLKSDGTVVAVGNNKYGKCDVSDWKNIKAVSAGHYLAVGLKSDGANVVVDYPNVYVDDWHDIVAVSAGDLHAVGLKSDGTVVAASYKNEYGQCDVSSWRNIVAVSAGDYFTVGLKSDGTAVAVGDNKYGQCGVSDWKDIKIPAARTIG